MCSGGGAVSDGDGDGRRRDFSSFFDGEELLQERPFRGFPLATDGVLLCSVLQLLFCSSLGGGLFLGQSRQQAAGYSLVSLGGDEDLTGVLPDTRGRRGAGHLPALLGPWFRCGGAAAAVGPGKACRIGANDAASGSHAARVGQLIRASLIAFLAALPVGHERDRDREREREMYLGM